MRCPQCSQILIWQSDFEYEEWFIEGEGVVGTYACVNEECNVDDVYIFTPTDATL